MRRQALTVALILAAGAALSGCVIVSKSDVHDSSLASACPKAGGASGIDRRQLIDATSAFDTLERLQVFCADSGTSRTMLKVSGWGVGGHMERTFVVRGAGLEPVS